MSYNFLHHGGTPSEYFAAVGRIGWGAMNGLTLTHLPVMSAGFFGLFAIGVNESRLWLRPSPSSYSMARYVYMARYGIAQLIPSLIPETQPASILAQRSGLASGCVFADTSVLQKEMPKRYLRYVRSVSFRCAIAGSILLSQVVSAVNILMDAQDDYVESIKQGREPPLNVLRFNGTNESGLGNQGVVIRLAGETSDVTTQSLAIEGRNRIFPVFEKPNLHNVETMVREYGCGSGDDPLVPVYWRVPNGRYGRADSWRDLEIPKHWLHDVVPTASRVRENRPTKMLILEADATSGDAASLSLRRKHSSELDLDLYEVEQGFHNLQTCVDAERTEFETIRVLLVDPEVVVEKGGGVSQTANEYIRELGLVDVVIDARKPLTHAMSKWVESVPDAHVSHIRGGAYQKLTSILDYRKLRPVILWTPNESWFQSIRSELAPLGYDVISYREGLRRYGKSGARRLPLFVYEKSISDSVHTTNRLVEKGKTGKYNVCSLFPQHFNKNRGEEEHQYASICSTTLYNRLFSWVRERALDGHSAMEIQRELDSQLETGKLIYFVEEGIA